MSEALRRSHGVQLRRGDLSVIHDDICEIVRDAHNPLSVAFISREELEQILELARVLLLQESLCAARPAWVPTEPRPPATVLGLLA